ncbi:MAG: FtsX-like permease family protein [Oscillospiraceae bacterium]|nr:FtsX-like permease family protein [Oscillospiraceae bacterium]
MWKNKWMMLCLLIGNILLVGIVSGTPLYSEAIMQRILIKDMQQIQVSKNIHPATSELQYRFYGIKQESSVATYERTRDQLVPQLMDDLDLPVLNMVQSLTLDGVFCYPVDQREENPRPREVSLVSYEGQAEHLRLLQGRMPADSIVEGNIIEFIASERAVSTHDLLLNELMYASIVTRLNEDNERPTPQLYMMLVGIYEGSDSEELYWTKNPNNFTNLVLVSDKLINNVYIENYDKAYSITSSWIIMLDYNSLRAENVAGYQTADAKLKAQFNSGGAWWYGENFISALEEYSLRASKLSLSLLVLQVPIYVLMAFYIFMVSRQILQLEQNDISVLKSRGASRGQIFTIYLLQSLFVAALSLAAGVPLGMAVCRILGASSGFLTLASRYSLALKLSNTTLVYSAAAALASILMMLAPVVRFSRIAIVDYKRNKYGRIKKPLWQRSFLDILSFGLSLYALYNFNSQREIIARAVTDARTVDPVLFLSSSLFIVGMGLLCLRLFPLLVRLIFQIGKRKWAPSLHVSLLRIIRSAGEEQFVMIFLVFTLAVGIFSAKAARTINQNSDDQIMQQVGTDVVLAEGWSDNRPPMGMGSPQLPIGFKLIYYEPDFERFTGLEQVDSIAQVQVTEVTLRRTRNEDVSAKLMAIDTKDFGNTLWYRNDLLPVHINNFLNSLASRDDGLLLSMNFKTSQNYRVGQTFAFYNGEGEAVEGVISGFVDNWPGYTAVKTVIDPNGVRVQEDQFLIVANLAYVQSFWGVYPYQIWMKTNTPTNAFVYDLINEKVQRLIFFEDAKANVVESKGDPILQGTNGVLTVGFIMSLVVCFTGFLIYWILSIRSRVLQFGVFRAIGMTKRNIIGILISEQVCTTLMSVAIGTVVGEVSSRFFIPLIQISYNASDQVIPLLLFSEKQDYVNLFSVIGLMILICLAVLGAIISRLKIAQALKLGED